MRGVLLSVLLVGNLGLGSMGLAQTLPAPRSGKILFDKKIKTSGPTISVQKSIVVGSTKKSVPTTKNKPERPFVGERGQVINGKWFALSSGIRSNLPRDTQTSISFLYGFGSPLQLSQKTGVTATHTPLEIRRDSQR